MHQYERLVKRIEELEKEIDDLHKEIDKLKGDRYVKVKKPEFPNSWTWTGTTWGQ